MRIADILERKGGTVHSVQPWTTVANTVARLAEAGVGALLVRDGDGAVRGIVSERDIVLALRKHGAALLTMEAGAVMTRKVHTCTPDETVAHAMAQMTVGGNIRPDRV